jgi:hypothetical protein
MESIQKKAERRRSRSTRRGRDRTRVPEKAKEPAPATSATTLQDIKEEEGDSIESRMAERQTPSVEDVPGIEDIEQKHQETTRNLDEFLRRQQELEQEAPSQVMEEEGRDEEEEVEEEEEPSIPSYQLTRLKGYITRVEEYDNQISQMNELIKREVDEEARKGQKEDLKELKRKRKNIYDTLVRIKRESGISGMSNEQIKGLMGSGFGNWDDDDEDEVDEKGYESPVENSDYERARINREMEKLIPEEYNEFKQKVNYLANTRGLYSSTGQPKEIVDLMRSYGGPTVSQDYIETIAMYDPDLRRALQDKKRELEIRAEQERRRAEATSRRNARVRRRDEMLEDENLNPQQRRRLNFADDDADENVGNLNEDDDENVIDLDEDDGRINDDDDDGGFQVSRINFPFFRNLFDDDDTIGNGYPSVGNDDENEYDLRFGRNAINLNGEGMVSDLYKKAKDTIKSKYNKAKERFRVNPFSLGILNNNYCGPGTQLEGQPALSKTDAICKDHDYRYNAVKEAKQRGVSKEELAKMTREADRIMLDELKQVEEKSLGDRFIHLASTLGISGKVLAEDLGLLDPTRFSASGRKPTKKVMMKHYTGMGFGQDVSEWILKMIFKPAYNRLVEQFKKDKQAREEARRKGGNLLQVISDYENKSPDEQAQVDQGIKNSFNSFMNAIKGRGFFGDFDLSQFANRTPEQQAQDQQKFNNLKDTFNTIVSRIKNR